MNSLRHTFSTIARQRDHILKKTAWGRENLAHVDQQIEDLKYLVESLDFSSDYKRMHGIILSDFEKKLCNLPAFNDAARCWPYFNSEDRLRTGYMAGTLQALVQKNISGFNVHPPKYIEADPNCRYLAISSTNLYDMRGLHDRFTIQSKHLHGSFENFMHSIAHEQTHQFHTWMARACLRGDISKFNTLWRDAEMLVIAKQEKAYIHGVLPDVYDAQFEEKDAERAGYTARRCAIVAQGHFAPIPA